MPQSLSHSTLHLYTPLRPLDLFASRLLPFTSLHPLDLSALEDMGFSQAQRESVEGEGERLEGGG